MSVAAAAVVIAAVAVTGLGPDHSEPEKSVTHWTRQAQYDVYVTFRYTSHPWAHDDSFPDGDTYWGYTLIPRDGRLLISDDGTG